MTNLLIDNAFQLEVAAKQIISIESLEDALSLRELQLDSYLVLGSATNMIVDKFYDGTIIKVSMREIEQISEDITSVGAGLSWDKLISYCLDNKLFGIENLTLIPGSVGAAPVQNIGAYGVEVSSVIESVTCYNFSTKQVEILSKAECKFSYRQSIFQSKAYLILSVQFRFSKVFNPNISYPSLLQFLEQESINHDSLSSRQLSSAIQSIRESKLVLCVDTTALSSGINAEYCFDGDGSTNRTIFFLDFFTVLIMADILILLVSHHYITEFAHLARNTGFILSTVILRVAIASPGMSGAILFILAGCLGSAVLLSGFVFSKKEQQKFAEME